MSGAVSKWEYRVETVGGLFSGVKAEVLEELLNEWGEEGWELISTQNIENTSKVNVIAKRPLISDTLRMRSRPSYQEVSMVERKPLLWFLVIAFAISWPLFLAPLVLPDLELAARQISIQGLWALAMWGPGVAAVFTTLLIAKEPIKLFV